MNESETYVTREEFLALRLLISRQPGRSRLRPFRLHSPQVTQSLLSPAAAAMPWLPSTTATTWLNHVLKSWVDSFSQLHSIHRNNRPVMTNSQLARLLIAFRDNLMYLWPHSFSLTFIIFCFFFVHWFSQLIIGSITGTLIWKWLQSLCF